MEDHESVDESHDESSLSSGSSDDSTDDGNGTSGRSGRGNFAVGVQRAPRYSGAEKRMLVITYGKYFGQNVLPDGRMQRIRRRFNKWLRTTGVMHNGFPLKRTRNGLRQLEQKLFVAGWTWRDGRVVPAPSPPPKKSAGKQKRAATSSPANSPVSANDGWEGYEGMRKQSLKEKRRKISPEEAAMLAQAEAALETVGDDDVVMSGAHPDAVAQPQMRANSPRVLGRTAQPAPGQFTFAGSSHQAQQASVQPHRPAPSAPRSLVRELEAVSADARRLHDIVFGLHRLGCGCGKPFK